MERTKQNIKRMQWETDPLYRLIRTIKNVMDRYFLDPLIGLLFPTAGDIFSSVMTLPFLAVSLFRIKSIPLTLAIVYNMLTDMLLGIIPLWIGDLLDIFSRSYTKNFRLIVGFVEGDQDYIEAYYLRYNTLEDATLKKYWTELRSRAGVDTDFQKTINATDLSKEIDLARYSGKELVDKTLYNIRRERRSELIAEGMRKDDLYRWRSLDMMQNYWVEGMNYWDEFHTDFEAACTACKLNYTAPNDASVSKYLRPQAMNELVKKYNGYCFEEANYLSPLSYDVFRMSTPVEGGDVSTSVVYQNPGWPVKAGSYANQ